MMFFIFFILLYFLVTLIFLIKLLSNLDCKVLNECYWVDLPSFRKRKLQLESCCLTFFPVYGFFGWRYLWFCWNNRLFFSWSWFFKNLTPFNEDDEKYCFYIFLILLFLSFSLFFRLFVSPVNYFIYFFKRNQFIELF